LEMMARGEMTCFEAWAYVIDLSFLYYGLKHSKSMDHNKA
jgi:hypothetical protein